MYQTKQVTLCSTRPCIAVISLILLPTSDMNPPITLALSPSFSSSKFLNTPSISCCLFVHSSNMAVQFSKIEFILSFIISNCCCITSWNREFYFRLFFYQADRLDNWRFSCRSRVEIGMGVFCLCQSQRRQRQVRMKRADFIFCSRLFFRRFTIIKARSQPQLSSKLVVIESTKSEVPITPAQELTTVTMPPSLVTGLTSPKPTVVMVIKASQIVLPKPISPLPSTPFSNTRQQQAKMAMQNRQREEIRITGCWRKRQRMLQKGLFRTPYILPTRKLRGVEYGVRYCRSPRRRKTNFKRDRSNRMWFNFREGKGQFFSDVLEIQASSKCGQGWSKITSSSIINESVVVCIYLLAIAISFRAKNRTEAPKRSPAEVASSPQVTHSQPQPPPATSSSYCGQKRKYIGEEQKEIGHQGETERKFYQQESTVQLEDFQAVLHPGPYFLRFCRQGFGSVELLAG